MRFGPEPSRDSPFVAGRVPPASWVLVAAAVLTVAFGLISRGLVGRYLILSAEHVIPIAEMAAPFALAAAIVAGAERWPAGRSRLLIGAALHALLGVLSLAQDTWFWWSTRNGPGIVGEVEQALLIGASFVIWLLGSAGSVMLALGLWPTAYGSLVGGRRLAAVAIGSLGLVAAAGAAWIPTMTWADLAMPWAMLDAVVPLAMAFVGVAAVRGVPGRHRLPEVLIATGATLFVAAMAWSHWFLNATRLENIPVELLDLTLLLPRGVIVAGVLVASTGFASARLFPIRSRDD